MPDTPLHRADLHPDPVEQFRLWRAARTDEEADAVAFATATRDGRPSVRMVLLKGFDADGFRFGTNRESRKGHELAENPRGALLHYDSVHGRQVRVEGAVAVAPDAVSDAAWAVRPRASRLSASVSRQSAPAPDRAGMESAVRDADARSGDADVPRPAHWVAYRLVPDYFEFWQHRANRLHDRFAYQREGSRWRITRLWP